MKQSTNTITLFATLAAGILMIIFNGRTDLFSLIVIILGIMLAVPSLVAGIRYFTAKGREDQPSWTILIPATGGLILGVLMLCAPGVFVHYLIYTFGVVLILVGIMQLVFLMQGGWMAGAYYSLIIVPSLTIGAGLLIIVLGPEKLQSAVTLIVGIALTIYSLNGFAGMLCHKNPSEAH